VSEDERLSLHVIVRGHVQGVGFRDFVLTRARHERLTGYTRNLPDGRSVEVVAEGSRSQLERLIEQLGLGPRSARVDSVETHWSPATGSHAEFGVTY
jgi:acylphosphatase